MNRKYCDICNVEIKKFEKNFSVCVVQNNCNCSNQDDIHFSDVCTNCEYEIRQKINEIVLKRIKNKWKSVKVASASHAPI